VDCLGLLVLSLAAAGYDVSRDRVDYGREPWRDGLRQALQSHFGAPVTPWRVGDVALIKWDNQQEPAHLGILGDYPYGGFSLIHAYSAVAVTEHRLDEVWRKRIVEVYRPWPN
jgi:hypothetical protein